MAVFNQTHFFLQNSINFHQCQNPKQSVAEGLPKVRRDQLISDANDCYDDDDELPATVLPICTNNNNPIAQKL